MYFIFGRYLAQQTSKNDAVLFFFITRTCEMYECIDKEYGVTLL